MHVLRRRILELLISAIILSLITAGIFHFNIIAVTQYNIAIICLFMSAVFIVVTVRDLQRNILFLTPYFKYNYGAYLIFMAINLGFAFFAPNELYSLLFAFTRVFSYLYSPVSYIQSAMLFHFVMIFVITVVPFTLPKSHRRRIDNIKLFIGTQNQNVAEQSSEDEAAPAGNN